MDRRTTLLLVLLLVFSFGIRVPFIGVPLERDEGVRAVIAEGMLEGQLPYRDFVTNKPPGVLFIYALVLKTFGASGEAIHLSLILVSLATTLALFGIGLAMTRSALVAFVAALAFAVTSMSPRVYGTAANLEQFMALPIALAVLCLWRGLEKESTVLLLASGGCAGIAMAVKQAGIFTLLLLLAVPAYEILALRQSTLRRGARHVLALVAGAAVPMAALGLWLWSKGTLAPALHWILRATASYVFGYPFQVRQFLNNTVPVVLENPLVYALAVVGLVRALRTPSRAHGILLCWTGLAACSVVPGMRFIPHYYILLLLPVSLACGLGAQALSARLSEVRTPARRGAAGAALVALALAFPVIAYLPYLAAGSTDAASRLTYPRSFFAETRAAGRYIEAHTAPNDTILVVGNEPQLCFYARRRSATRHVGFFYLFQRYRDEGTMQREAYDEIVRNDPAYIVRFYGRPSLEIGPHSDTGLLERLDELAARSYALDGLGTVSSGTPGIRRCIFGADARAFTAGPDQRVFMRLYRKSTSQRMPPP